MEKLMKNIYEHLKTRKKYNTLENDYQVIVKLYEERTNERDAQASINKTLKKKFDEEIDNLIKEKIALKEEIRKLKSKRKGEK